MFLTIVFFILTLITLLIITIYKFSISLITNACYEIRLYNLSFSDNWLIKITVHSKIKKCVYVFHIICDIIMHPISIIQTIGEFVIRNCSNLS